MCLHISYVHICTFVSSCYIPPLPGQHILQSLHQSHLVLSSQRGLEQDLWTPQTLRPHKELVILCHVEHRLQRLNKKVIIYQHEFMTSIDTAHFKCCNQQSYAQKLLKVSLHILPHITAAGINEALHVSETFGYPVPLPEPHQQVFLAACPQGSQNPSVPLHLPRPSAAPALTPDRERQNSLRLRVSSATSTAAIKHRSCRALQHVCDNDIYT